VPLSRLAVIIVTPVLDCGSVTVPPSLNEKSNAAGAGVAAGGAEGGVGTGVGFAAGGVTATGAAGAGVGVAVGGGVATGGVVRGMVRIAPKYPIATTMSSGRCSAA
jgi:hypothetical protein